MADNQNPHSDESVTEWIAYMKDGDATALNELWQRYFDRICHLANRKLAGAKRSAVDEHDLASEAMQAIWEGANTGRFRQLENRDDLWQLLVVITSRKVANVHRHQAVRGERNSDRSQGDNLVVEFADLLESPPTESLIDQIPLSCQDLLSNLDQSHRETALMRLAGHSNLDIADKQKCSVATVERRLKSIRQTWAEHAPSS